MSSRPALPITHAGLLDRIEQLERIVVALADRLDRRDAIDHALRTEQFLVAARRSESDTYEPTPDEVQALWADGGTESVQLRFCRCVGDDHDEDCYKRYR